MPINAYIFIDCSIDPADVVRRVREIDGVKNAHALYGDIEAVAYVEVKDLKELDDILLKFYEIPGLESTDTRIAREIE
jgi:DNA-binding Lrp family transcriptional regulator